MISYCSNPFEDIQTEADCEAAALAFKLRARIQGYEIRRNGSGKKFCRLLVDARNINLQSTCEDNGFGKGTKAGGWKIESIDTADDIGMKLVDCWVLLK